MHRHDGRPTVSVTHEMVAAPHSHDAGMRVLDSFAGGTLRQRRQEFRELAAPALHRARQLGLSEAEIRTVLDNLLADMSPARHSQ